MTPYWFSFKHPFSRDGHLKPLISGCRLVFRVEAQCHKGEKQCHGVLVLINELPAAVGGNDRFFNWLYSRLEGRAVKLPANLTVPEGGIVRTKRTIRISFFLKPEKSGDFTTAAEEARVSLVGMQQHIADSIAAFERECSQQ